MCVSPFVVDYHCLNITIDMQVITMTAMSIVIAIGSCFSISLGSIKRDRMMMTFMMIHGDMPVFPFVCGFCFLC